MAKSGVFTSAAGWLADFAGQIEEALYERGCTDEEIRALVTRKPRPKLAIGKIADEVAEVIRQAGNCFRLMVGGRITSELVKRGRYDWVNSSITDTLFPIEKHAPVSRTIELVKFDYNPTSEEVLAEFARRGLERPTHEDALTFGSEYPEEQRKCPVVFLHEPVLVDGGRCVLVLDEDGRERSLGLDWFVDGWDRRYVFAAVRK